MQNCGSYSKKIFADLNLIHTDMKAAIYNPYWDTLGGGERYTISFAKVLTELGYRVDVQWKDNDLMKRIEERFGIKTMDINVVSDIKKGDGYDICFWISDGSIPLLRSRNNILHFQVPFTDVKGDSLMNKMKLYRVKKVICNSQFTKKVIDKEYRINSIVVYPPCDTTKIKPKRKENIILSVGRFSQLLQSKHQDILIEVFIKLIKKGVTDWKLVLAGGSGVGGVEYLDGLKKEAEKYPIEFHEDPDYKEIIELYGRSKIFWSASGYAENEQRNPEKVEHFGIALIEAMAGGCVPVVLNAGGHKEIIGENNGYLWSKRAEVVRITRDLITDGKLLRNVSKNAIVSSKTFGYERFKESVEKILQ